MGPGFGEISTYSMNAVRSGVSDTLIRMHSTPFSSNPHTSGSCGGFGFSFSASALTSAGFADLDSAATAGTVELLTLHVADSAAATACVVTPATGCSAGSVWELSQPLNAKINEEHARSVRIFIFE